MSTADHAAEIATLEPTPAPIPAPRILRWKRSVHPFWHFIGILRWGRQPWQQSAVHAETLEMLQGHARLNGAHLIEVAEGEAL
jgi:hypothetical protein